MHNARPHLSMLPSALAAISRATLVWSLALGVGTIAPASAAEPAIQIPGGSFPVTLTGSEPTAFTELQNAAGTLKGTGVSVRIEATAARSGTYTATFKAVKKGAESCNSAGAGAGEVVIPATNTVKLVYDALGTELSAGLLFNLAELEVKCGTTKVFIRGTDLGAVGPINATAKTAGFMTTLKCSHKSGGEPFDVDYWENTETVFKVALLEANFGTGFKKACELIETFPSVFLELSASKSVTIAA